MSKTTEECGGEAFPGAFGCGMTLRDYFAGQAVAGYITTWTDSAVKPEYIASVAYKIADAMLAARGEIEG